MKSAFDPSTTLVDELLLIRRDRTESRLTIRIGLPVQRGDSWACPCEIEGFEPQYPDVLGGNPLQAMSIALKLVRSRLCSIIEKGQNLCFPNDRVPLTVRLVRVWLGGD